MCRGPTILPWHGSRRRAVVTASGPVGQLKRPKRSEPTTPLPLDLWRSCLDFLTVAELGRLAATSRHGREAVASPAFWAAAAHARLDNLGALDQNYDARELLRLYTETRKWRQVHDEKAQVPGGAAIPAADVAGPNAGISHYRSIRPAAAAAGGGPDEPPTRQLLMSVSGRSSCDRDEESAFNTLSESVCGCIVERLRQRSRRAAEAGGGIDVAVRCPLLLSLVAEDACGCNSTPCYWSSAGNPDPDSCEWISYTVPSGISVITQFSITPYQVVWHPECPTYAPHGAQLVLRHPDIAGGKPYWVSEVFPVVAEMRDQRFVLPKPVVCFGGEAVVCFVGKARRQTLGPHDGYYISLSSVRVSGIDLHGALCLEPARSLSGVSYTPFSLSAAAAGQGTAAAAVAKANAGKGTATAAAPPPPVGRIASKMVLNVRAAPWLTSPQQAALKSYIVSSNMLLSNVLDDYEATAGGLNASSSCKSSGGDGCGGSGGTSACAGGGSTKFSLCELDGTPLRAESSLAGRGPGPHELLAVPTSLQAWCL